MVKIDFIDFRLPKNKKKFNRHKNKIECWSCQVIKKSPIDEKVVKIVNYATY